MGRWTDVAAWAGPIVNSGDGDGRPNEPEDRMPGHVGVVIHTAEGSYAGTDSWQRNPAAQVGSHFLTAKDGRAEQLIDTDDRSWCQSAGNSTWLSIENEGYGSRGESLSAGQVEACARILAKAHQVYGVPLQVSNSPSTPGLGWHGMGAAAWGGHNDCPGNAIKAQLPAIVARAQQILTPTPQEPEMELSNEFTSTRSGKTSLANAFATTLDDVHLDIKPAIARVESKVAELAGKVGQPAPVTLTDADRDDIATRTAAKLAATVAQAVADEVAKRLGNG